MIGAGGERRDAGQHDRGGSVPVRVGPVTQLTAAVVAPSVGQPASGDEVPLHVDRVRAFVRVVVDDRQLEAEGAARARPN